MIIALKEKGHTVAMTGDGVNDVMALKEADCSIAMGSGSEAAKKIASIVLLNDQFNKKYEDMSPEEKIKYLENKNQYLEAENEYLKKLRAAVQKKKNQQSKKK